MFSIPEWVVPTYVIAHIVTTLIWSGLVLKVYFGSRQFSKSTKTLGLDEWGRSNVNEGGGLAILIIRVFARTLEIPADLLVTLLLFGLLGPLA